MQDIAAKILGDAEGESLGDPFETIASEFALAFEAKDHKQIVKTLKAFIAMQGAEPETDD